jgi:hypothetical protein
MSKFGSQPVLRGEVRFDRGWERGGMGCGCGGKDAEWMWESEVRRRSSEAVPATFWCLIVSIDSVEANWHHKLVGTWKSS